MSEWRYVAFRPDGRGCESLAHPSLPLYDVSVKRVLSGVDEITGSMTLSRGLVGPDGLPILKPWGSTVYAERDGSIVAGGIVTDIDTTGSELHFTASGFVGYLQNLPFTGEFRAYEVDPMDMARYIWGHAQSSPGGNIGMVVSAETTGGRRKIGVRPVKAFRGRPVIKDALGNVVLPAAPATPKVADEPFLLAWYENHDLLKDFVQLATETPFDFVERHSWLNNEVEHFLDMHFPRLGFRRSQGRFIVGENVFTEPTVSMPPEMYASDIMVLGAGEGAKMVKGVATDASAGRLRRVETHKEANIGRASTAEATARRQLSFRMGGFDIDEVVVKDGPSAPFGSYDLGDEILVQSDGGWLNGADVWVRIMEMDYRPGDGDDVTLTVEREGVAQ